MSNSKSSSGIQASAIGLWARAAHDLRQPIQSLLLQTTVIANTEHAAERHQIEQQMEDALLGLQSMLDDLGALGRLQVGIDALNPTACKVPDVLAEVASEIADVSTEQKVSLKIEAAAIGITSDARLIAKVIAGLVLNAMEFGTGSEIVIGARQSDIGTAIDVEFDGPPIPPGRQALAFIELRSRPHSGAVRRTALGQGLIVQLAAILGGTVEYVSLSAHRQRLSLAMPADRAAVATS